MTSRPSLRLLSVTTALAVGAGGLGLAAGPAAAAPATFAQPVPVHASFADDPGSSTDYTLWKTTSTPVDVPDGASTSSSVTVAEPAAGRVSWVSAYVDVTHQSIDDLDLVLVSPDGRAATLASDVGGPGAVAGRLEVSGYYNVAPFGSGGCATGCAGRPTDLDPSGDVDARPGAAADFAVFGGTPANGTWTLWAYDDSTGDTGRIDGWGLELWWSKDASPSPSTVSVSGLPARVTDVDLVLDDVTGWLEDTEVVLESPDGRRAHVLSDTLRAGDVTDLDLVLDDEATASVPELAAGAVSGTYRPLNFDDASVDQSEFVGGVEAVDMDSALSAFDGGTANGTWKLWVSTEWCCSEATFSWSLRVSAVDPPAVPVVPVTSPPPPAPADTTAPALRKVTPRDGAKDVRRSVSPTVRFAEAMDRASLEKGVVLRMKGGAKVKAAYRWDAKRLTLTVDPRKKLADDTAYVLRVRGSARDVAGNPLARGAKTRFRT